MSEKIIGKLTIQNPTVNVRRGPTISAAILREAIAGETFHVLSVLKDPTGKTMETWVQIVYPENLTLNAFICYRLNTGRYLGNYEPVSPQGDTGGYDKGWNDAVSAMISRLGDMKR